MDLPFGGLTTILVRDFDQKKPCKKGSSLAQILVNYTTEDVQNTERARIAGVFQQFRKFELTGSERIKNKDDELHQILHHIKMNDPPITLELLERLPKLKRLDEMTNSEKEKWRFCPVMCTSNETRNGHNETKIQHSGKYHNRPILTCHDIPKSLEHDPTEIRDIATRVL